MAESKTPMGKYWVGRHAPEHADAWFGFYKSIGTEGVLDKKTKELICVAAGCLMRCHHCVTAHVKDAMKAGATREEIAEAITTAASIASGSQFFWMNQEMDKLLGE